MNVIRDMQLIQNAKQFLNKQLSIKVVKSTVSLYMVRASVFFENNIHIKTLELIEQINIQLKQFSRRVNLRLIGSEKLRAAGGIVSFSYDTSDARKTFAYVALLHLIVFLMLYSLSALHQKKTPDIMIELGGAPQASSGGSTSMANQASPNPVKDAPKAPPAPEKVDPDVIKAQEVKRLEKKKELELEREKRKEIERDRQKQREREREIEIDRKRDLERERQRNKELEQERKKEQERVREQERQQKLKDQQQEKQKQKEKLSEPKKVDKDGTLPPPPAPASSSAPPSSSPPASSSPPPLAPPPPSSAPAAGAPPSSSSGSSGSISATVSNGPSAAPTLDSDAKASYLTNPKPAYPMVAFKMKIEGKVILVVEVLESGAVNKVAIGESSGNESLDRSALETVKNWKFTPARKNGVIVSQVVRVPITFSLKNR